MKKTIFQRFFDFIDDETSDCWLWLGGKDPDGYGIFSENGKSVRAHRWAWYGLSAYEIPKGMNVLHKCDNPSCVKPEHLFLGTNEDNMADRNNKNRQAKHERNGQSKLSKEKVDYIRKSDFSDVTLGKMFGVTRQTIWNARTYRLWN